MLLGNSYQTDAGEVTGKLKLKCQVQHIGSKKGHFDMRNEVTMEKSNGKTQTQVSSSIHKSKKGHFDMRCNASIEKSVWKTQVQNQVSSSRLRVESYGLKVIFSEFVSTGIGLSIFGWLDCHLDCAQGDSSKWRLNCRLQTSGFRLPTPDRFLDCARNDTLTRNTKLKTPDFGLRTSD